MKKTNRSKKIWFISIGCLIVIIAYLITFQRNLLYLSYYYIKADSFSKGDKVYLKNDKLTPNRNYNVTWRLIRPINNADTLNINLDTSKRLVISSTNTNSTLKPYMIPFRRLIIEDNLKKNKSACIGYYLFNSINYVKATDNTFVLCNFVALKIDPNVFELHGEPLYEIPQNYTLADSTFYTYVQDVSNKEAQKFK